jgi:hypothetical protein
MDGGSINFVKPNAHAMKHIFWPKINLENTQVLCLWMKKCWSLQEASSYPMKHKKGLLDS